MFREKWSHFLPEFIADLPLVARHTSPSKIAIIYDLTIPFGIGSYRITENSVNGMTLGAFTGYFRNRSSYKNALFPYEHYEKHYVLGVIYSRSDIDSITQLLTAQGFKLTAAKRKLLITYMNNASDENWELLTGAYHEDVADYRLEIDSYLVDELESYNLDNFESIVSVARNFEFFVQEKWRLAVDRPGSGNTKNIGSETLVRRLLNEEGLFFREYGANGEAEFDKYWMQYQTKDMARALEQDEPIYRNLHTFRQWLASLQNNK
ncbi:type II restriction endonuclease [Mixta mediterraneensis]|uniref:type II restriction endonuclease n=1 Tax=Mixta mediterraneensis TaxID=2758443 RepID=UPI0023AA7034|nr:type II restriction endonuclease [Mixta mediterraneensis]